MKRFVLVVMAFAMLLAVGCSDNQGIRVTQKRMAKPESAFDEKESSEDTTENEMANETLYVIADINLETKAVTLMDIDSGKQRTYKYDSRSVFLDKYGDRKSIESFEKGYAVTAEANSDEAGLNRMQISGEAFVYDEIIRFKIDQTNRVINIAGDDYYYDNVLGCYCDDSRIMLSTIKSGDEIRVVGLDKRILSVVVTSGHGVLTLENTTLFDGSVMCVGLEILKKVEPGLQFELPEGKYLVTVANDGWGSSKEIVIERNKEMVLDLDTMKGEGPKFCKLSFDLKGIEEATIEIDGEEMDFSEPQDVRYGTHSLKITADGYEPIEKSLVVNSEEATIELELSVDGNVPDTSDNDKKDDNENDKTEENITNNTGGTTGGNTDTSQTDYLTTLYNLLTAISKAQNGEN